MEGLRAVIYCRVSSQEQAESGTSLASQEQACLEKAESLEAQIVAPVFRDEGISGATLVGRPGLQAALSVLDAGKANVLICYDVSRLSRDVEHHGKIERRVKKGYGRIIYCTQDFADTADGKLMGGLHKQFAAWERDKIRERTMKGRRTRAKEGYQPHRTLSPMGYHIVTDKEVLTGVFPAGTQGTYQIVESEAVIIRELFRRAASGMSLCSLAGWLMDSNVPTRQGGSRWRPSAIRFILNNPTYKGEVLVGRKESFYDEERREQGFKMSYFLRDRKAEDCIRIAIPALVTDEMWETVQARLKDNKARMSGRKVRRFVLSGLFRCPDCGNRGSVAHSAGRSHSYYCKQKKFCHKTTYLGRIAEEAVYQILETIAERPELIETAIDAYTKREKSVSNKETQDSLLRELESLQAQERGTVKAQIAGVRAGADTAIYEELLTEISGKRKQVQERLATMEAEQNRPDFNPKDVSGILGEVLTRVRFALRDDSIEPHEKNEILSAVVQSVTPESKTRYRVNLHPLPGTGITVQQTLTCCIDTCTGVVTILMEDTEPLALAA